MTEDDKKVLQEQDNDTLAEWWCTLNRWDWPEGLPDPMTEEERTDYDLKTISAEEFYSQRDSRIMKWISDRIGEKKISRCWNKDSMDDEQFELFWRGTYEGDEEAAEKHKAWRIERAKVEVAERA
jgi:hypothetical protein